MRSGKVDKMKVLVRSIYRWVFPALINYFKRELQDCQTVLDLGCGKNSLIRLCAVPYSIGIELFKPYLEESKGKGIHSEYILANVRDIEFKEKSFDAVLAIDLIEHLTKEDGLRLIEKMGRWARKKVIITTPNGFLWQDGYDNNLLQVHRSGWNVDELRIWVFKSMA